MILNALQTLRRKAAHALLGHDFAFRNGQFERLWGVSDYEVISVTPLSSLKTSSVWSCVRLIAGVAASLPIDVYERVGDRREKRQRHPVETLLDSQPNPEMSANAFRFASWAHFLLWGNSYARKVYSGSRLIALWLLDPRYMTVRREPSGMRELVYVYDDPETQTRTTYRQADILHIPNFSLDGINGMSVIEQAQAGVALNQIANRNAARAMSNAAKPSLNLEVPHALQEKTRAEMKERLRRESSGSASGEPLITENGSKLHVLNMPYKDALYLETIQATDEQVAMMFGVPPAMIGILSKTTSWGTGVSELKQGFLDFTLAPLLKAYEGSYDRALLSDREPEHYIKHNTGAYLRMDLLRTMQAFEVAIRSRIYSPNEARAFLDMNGYEGGDEYFAQMQDIPISAALQNTAGTEQQGGGGQ
jgi:HK97 family phage portal protein